MTAFVSMDRYRGAIMVRDLKKLSARAKYYFEQHRRR